MLNFRGVFVSGIRNQTEPPFLLGRRLRLDSRSPPRRDGLALESDENFVDCPNAWPRKMAGKIPGKVEKSPGIYI